MQLLFWFLYMTAQFLGGKKWKLSIGKPLYIFLPPKIITHVRVWAGNLKTLKSIYWQYISLTFPEFVTPYVKHKPFWPSRISFTNGKTVASKKAFWSTLSSKTWLKVNSWIWSTKPLAPDLKVNESLGAWSSTFVLALTTMQSKKNYTVTLI